MTTETKLDPKPTQDQPIHPGEGTQTGGSATARETAEVADIGNTYSTNASPEEANVDGSRDASRDGERSDEVEGVRS